MPTFYLHIHNDTLERHTLSTPDWPGTRGERAVLRSIVLDGARARDALDRTCARDGRLNTLENAKGSKSQSLRAEQNGTFVCVCVCTRTYSRQYLLLYGFVCARVNTNAGNVD